MKDEVDKVTIDMLEERAVDDIKSLAYNLLCDAEEETTYAHAALIRVDKELWSEFQLAVAKERWHLRR